MISTKQFPLYVVTYIMLLDPYIKQRHAQSVSYQVKIFACLTEEEALHAILFGFIHDMVESGITTSGNDTAHLEVHTESILLLPKKWKSYMIHT